MKHSCFFFCNCVGSWCLSWPPPPSVGRIWFPPLWTHGPPWTVHSNIFLKMTGKIHHSHQILYLWKDASPNLEKWFCEGVWLDWESTSDTLIAAAGTAALRPAEEPLMPVHIDLATLELIFLDLLIKTALFSLPLSLHPPPLPSYWVCSKQAAGVLGRSLRFHWGCELPE